MDYDLPAELIDAASRITPGPRVADGLAAARHRTGSRCASWCRASETNHVMDELYALGARAILVSAIHAARI